MTSARDRNGKRVNATDPPFVLRGQLRVVVPLLVEPQSRELVSECEKRMERIFSPRAPSSPEHRNVEISLRAEVLGDELHDGLPPLLKLLRATPCHQSRPEHHPQLSRRRRALNLDVLVLFSATDARRQMAPDFPDPTKSLEREPLPSDR